MKSAQSMTLKEAIKIVTFLKRYGCSGADLSKSLQRVTTQGGRASDLNKPNKEEA